MKQQSDGQTRASPVVADKVRCPADASRPRAAPDDPVQNKSAAARFRRNADALTAARWRGRRQIAGLRVVDGIVGKNPQHLLCALLAGLPGLRQATSQGMRGNSPSVQRAPPATSRPRRLIGTGETAVMPTAAAGCASTASTPYGASCASICQGSHQSAALRLCTSMPCSRSALLMPAISRDRRRFVKPFQYTAVAPLARSARAVPQACRPVVCAAKRLAHPVAPARRPTSGAATIGWHRRAPSRPLPLVHEYTRQHPIMRGAGGAQRGMVGETQVAAEPDDGGGHGRSLALGARALKNCPFPVIPAKAGIQRLSNL